MTANIIAIGDEILIGQTVNTNSAYIGEKLNELSVKINRNLVVGDDRKAILNAFKECREEADIVIVTGGLGPTHDDITRDCVVEFFETELETDESVLNDIRDFFHRRGREVTETNRKQSLVPRIAEPISNSKGTAPGFWIEREEKMMAVLPGVPAEMKQMITDFVLPRVSEKLGEGNEVVRSKTLLTTGIPESNLYDKLGSLDDLMNGSKLAFLPNQFGVKMRITVKGATEEEAKNQLTEIEQRIRSFVGRYIYGHGDENLEEVVARLLTDRGLTLAVAESCTGGLISHRLTNISGSSAYFQRGVISYSNAAKVENLMVDEDHLQKYGAVSLQVARQMALGIKAVSLTDIGLAVTGIMGPTGATADKPVGLVYIGLCDDKLCAAKEFRFGDDRLTNKDRTSQAALDMLRRHLLGISYDE